MVFVIVDQYIVIVIIIIIDTLVIIITLWLLSYCYCYKGGNVEAELFFPPLGFDVSNPFCKTGFIGAVNIEVCCCC